MLMSKMSLSRYSLWCLHASCCLLYTLLQSEYTPLQLHVQSVSQLRRAAPSVAIYWHRAIWQITGYRQAYYRRTIGRRLRAAIKDVCRALFGYSFWSDTRAQSVEREEDIEIEIKTERESGRLLVEDATI